MLVPWRPWLEESYFMFHKDSASLHLHNNSFERKKKNIFRLQSSEVELLNNSNLILIVGK